MTRLPNYLITRLLVVGFITLIVAFADEIHQAYVPGRDASITDVLLDLVGIILVLFFFFRLLKTKTSLIR
jgi:VanZ family protein